MAKTYKLTLTSGCIGVRTSIMVFRRTIITFLNLYEIVKVLSKRKRNC